MGHLAVGLLFTALSKLALYDCGVVISWSCAASRDVPRDASRAHAQHDHITRTSHHITSYTSYITFHCTSHASSSSFPFSWIIRLFCTKGV